jgi:hypothetical protein
MLRTSLDTTSGCAITNLHVQPKLPYLGRLCCCCLAVRCIATVRLALLLAAHDCSDVDALLIDHLSVTAATGVIVTAIQQAERHSLMIIIIIFAGGTSNSTGMSPSSRQHGDELLSARCHDVVIGSHGAAYAHPQQPPQP